MAPSEPIPSPQRDLTLALAQFASHTYDTGHNAGLILDHAERAHAAGAGILLCPELCLTGYLVDPLEQADSAISLDNPIWKPLLEASQRVALAVGFAEHGPNGECYNSAAFLHAGQIWHVHRKLYLPNYGGFDEGRRFKAGQHLGSFDTPWGRLAMLICADAWHPSLAYLLAHEGVDLILVLTASPEGGLDPAFDTMAAWERLNQTHALTLSMYVACTNIAGPEGGLVFTGGSHVAAPDGALIARLARYESDFQTVALDWQRLARQRDRLPFRLIDELEITVRLGSQVLEKRAALLPPK